MNTKISDTALRRPSAETLPDQPISGEVLLEKYAKGQERSVEDVRRRVAKALSAVEPENRRAHWEQKFYEAQVQGFVPAGRIGSAAGTTLSATLINCLRSGSGAPRPPRGRYYMPRIRVSGELY